MATESLNFDEEARVVFLDAIARKVISAEERPTKDSPILVVTISLIMVLALARPTGRRYNVVARFLLVVFSMCPTIVRMFRRSEDIADGKPIAFLSVLRIALCFGLQLVEYHSSKTHFMIEWLNLYSLSGPFCLSFMIQMHCGSDLVSLFFEQWTLGTVAGIVCGVHIHCVAVGHTVNLIAAVMLASLSPAVICLTVRGMQMFSTQVYYQKCRRVVPEEAVDELSAANSK